MQKIVLLMQDMQKLKKTKKDKEKCWKVEIEKLSPFYKDGKNRIFFCEYKVNMTE